MRTGVRAMAFDLSKFAATLGNVSDSDTGLRLISIALLDPNKRNFYPPVQELDALVESIEANGLLEPLTVVPGDHGRYRLISGHNRLKALRQLHDMDDANGRWDEIPCLVLSSMTEAQEECAIIEGNRQRKKGGALLAEEAKRLTESYVKRKEAGEEFKGRIRDRVAEALQVSATKLAVVSAIENNLKVPGFVEQWKKGDASESVLYEISKLPKDAQLHLWDEQCDGRFLTTDYTKKFATIWSCCPHECPYTGCLCENAEEMVRVKLRNGEIQCAGCCEKCKEQAYCGTKCRYIPEPESVTKFREEQAEKREEEAAERRAKEQAYNEAGRDAWARLEKAAKDRGLACAHVLEALGWDGRDYREMQQRAAGKIMGEGNSTVLCVHPFEECGVDEINAVADVLGVSVDWILGRPTPVYGFDKAAPDEALIGWQKLSEVWPTEGQLVLLSCENGLGGFQYQLAKCVGGADDVFPFVDPNDNLTCEDFEEFDQWIALEDRSK